MCKHFWEEMEMCFTPKLFRQFQIQMGLQKLIAVGKAKIFRKDNEELLVCVQKTTNVQLIGYFWQPIDSWQ